MHKHTRLKAALTAALALALALPALARDAAWFDGPATDWKGGTAPESITNQRIYNPEYDFMSRTFLVLALADRALAEPERTDAALATMDAAIADTLAREETHGQRWYLMDYADYSPWLADGRSLFVDGEILVMMGARRMVRDDAWRVQMGERADVVARSFGAASELPLAESYPDEGWTFCHAFAMVGLRMHELLDGADHSDLRRAWLGTLRTRLTDPETGMLVSEFDMRGRPADGPEGSSIWAVVACLSALDPLLAAEQYALARQQLGRSMGGFGYSREWVDGTAPRVDVDSGPLVPMLDASASASGFAIVASRALGDETWNRQLRRSLGVTGAVIPLAPGLAQVEELPVGSLVVAWGLGFGPLWERLAPQA